jgi:hybrid cluster-associated redox disulfide protein
MNYPTDLSPQMSVSDLLYRYPECIPVFLSHHMACVGCSMSAFDTIADAAQNYGLPVEPLLIEMRGVVQSPLKE